MSPREGWVSKATRRELVEAGELTGSIGQAALALARRVDNAERETGSSLASVVREHRRLMTEIRSRTTPTGDLVDEVKRKREQHAARAR